SVRVLVAHGGTDEVYSGQSPSVESISVAALEETVDAGLVDYVALGDRHSVTRVGSGDRIRYSGSPETTAFDDVEEDSGSALLIGLGRDGADGARSGCEVTALRTGRSTIRALTAQIDTDDAPDALAGRVQATGTT